MGESRWTRAGRGEQAEESRRRRAGGGEQAGESRWRRAEQAEESKQRRAGRGGEQSRWRRADAEGWAEGDANLGKMPCGFPHIWVALESFARAQASWFCVHDCLSLVLRYDCSFSEIVLREQAHPYGRSGIMSVVGMLGRKLGAHVPASVCCVYF